MASSQDGHLDHLCLEPASLTVDRAHAGGRAGGRAGAFTLNSVAWAWPPFETGCWLKWDLHRVCSAISCEGGPVPYVMSQQRANVTHILRKQSQEPRKQVVMEMVLSYGHCAG